MKNKFKKIFVPGGDGFVGQSVTKILKEKKLNFVSLSLKDGVDFRDFSQVNKVFKKEKFDAVINCAAFVGGIQFGYSRPGEMFFNNTLMSVYLIEAARINGVKRFVNPISNCAYPAHLTKFKEDEFWSGPLHESVLAYGFVRKASWVQGWAYKRQYDFNSTHLILPNMYGPRDHFDETRSHALGALVKKFADAKEKGLPEVIVWGTGRPIREWLFVEDGAEALVRALTIETSIDPINIGVGEGVSVLELAKMIKKATGYSGRITLDKSKPDGALCKIMDVKKMKRIFHWMPKIKIEKGIKKTVEWYRKNSIK